MTNIRDVAKEAGVAPITVSRVINNSGYVSDEIRERVEKAIDDLNYIPNRLGPSMRSKRSNTIGLIVTDITNPFWTTIVRGVEDATYKAGYHLFLCNSDESIDKEQEYVELMLSRQVDGFLIAPATNEIKNLEMIQTHNKPVIALDRYIAGTDISVVRGDSQGGAHILTKHLLDLNHRRIVLLNGPQPVSTALDRAAGYKSAMLEAGLSEADLHISWGEFTRESGYKQALEALQLRPRPTAIIAANNFIAVGVVQVLDKFGLKIPDDISVVVFDDLPEDINLRPFLTSIEQPAYEIGFLGANTLFDALKNEKDDANSQEIILPFELKIRSSSGPAIQN